MTARTIMNAQPVTLRSTDTVGKATRFILEHHLRHLPVVDDQGRYLGMFGIYSLLRLILPKAAILEGGLDDLSFIRCSLPELRERVREVETESIMRGLRTDIPMVHPETPLMETALVLLRARIALPVVEKDTGRLAGMISSWDALEKIAGGE